MIIFNKLDNYFVVSANSQKFLGFEMTANFRDTSPLTDKLAVLTKTQGFLGGSAPLTFLKYVIKRSYLMQCDEHNVI